MQWLFSGWEEHGFPSDSPGATDVLYEKAADGRWRIVEADLYLNASGRDWELESPVPDGKWDLLSVLTHELGHVAGLAHPCELLSTSGAPVCEDSASATEATMYPWYSSEQGTLEDDDIHGICFLYPAGDCGSSCPDDMFCSVDGCVPGCGDSICRKGEECIDGVCSAVAPVLPCSSKTDPSCPVACEADSDCQDTSTCVAGRCLHRSAPGDPCTDAGDCTTAACSDDGSCVSSCSADANCKLGTTCKKQASGGRVCEGSALPFGASCASADDCIGGQCLAGLTAKPTCTRLCGADYPSAPSCPAGWSCRSINDRHVCTPTRTVAGGCQVASGRSSSHRWHWASLVVVLIVGRRRRKGRAAHGGEARQSIAVTPGRGRD